ncbi:MAG: nitroreductase family protein [Gammaproteobacteria bacterium]
MLENHNKSSSLGQLICDRRTVHDFVDKPVPTEDVISAISAARWAPNHLRTEPWQFYLLSRSQAEQICKLNTALVRDKKGDKIADIKHRRWLAMPGWLVLTCPKNDDPIREREDYAACCCAAQNLSLVLWERNIGVKWTTGAVTREAGFFDIIGAEFETTFTVGLFWYGYPKTVPDQHRRPLEEILVIGE